MSRAGEEEKEAGPAAVTQTVDGGMGEEGKTKEWLQEEERGRGLSVSGPENYTSPLALLRFLPFKELHNFK